MADSARILVVDDDPDIVESLRLILESQSYEVLSAASAEEAFEKIQAHRPDLVLLDIMMPEGTEGFQLVWRVRNELPEDVADVPIIIVTAIHNYTDLRFYPEQSDGTYGPGEYLPVQGFIDKPVEPAELLAKVGQALQQRN